MFDQIPLSQHDYAMNARFADNKPCPKCGKSDGFRVISAWMSQVTPGTMSINWSCIYCAAKDWEKLPIPEPIGFPGRPSMICELCDEPVPSLTLICGVLICESCLQERYAKTTNNPAGHSY